MGIGSHIAWALLQSCHLLGDLVDTLSLSEPQFSLGITAVPMGKDEVTAVKG